MCKELKDELDKGGALAKQLVEHLLEMGADKATIPVSLESWKEPEFEVIVQRKQ